MSNDNTAEELTESAILPVNEVLTRTAGELRELADTADKLQNVLTNIIEENGAAASSQIYDLQRVDHMKQAIEGLTHFLQSLANDTPTDWSYDVLPAAKKIKMLALATRLLNQRVLQDEADEHDAGDCELF